MTIFAIALAASLLTAPKCETAQNDVKLAQNCTTICSNVGGGQRICNTRCY